MNTLFSPNNEFGGYPTILFILLLIWSYFWKGLALWKSSKSERKVWFIIILILNTVGIVEIIYILFLDKKKYDLIFIDKLKRNLKNIHIFK